MREDGEAEYVEYVSARMPMLYRAAYLLCGGDKDRADDVVQSTVTKLYQRWSQARRADNLDAYVHRMLVHAFVDEKRRPWSRVRLWSWTAETAETGETAEPHETTVESRSMLVAALRRLPPRQRAALVLRYLLDQPIEEVAEVLGCSPGTVKSQTSRGLATLRLLLGDTVLGVATRHDTGIR
jgi:RNA polymerase sigma-70 factor (sigma-E family)